VKFHNAIPTQLDLDFKAEEVKSNAVGLDPARSSMSGNTDKILNTDTQSG